MLSLTAHRLCTSNAAACDHYRAHPDHALQLPGLAI